jgi:serine/threonine protein kinase
MVLKLLSCENHPHLNSLLATYVQKSRYHLLFHWAESDLREYWRKTDALALDASQTASWLARECLGIAGGLLHIHGPHDVRKFGHQDSFPAEVKLIQAGGGSNASPGASSAAGQPSAAICHHGDIKAQNILVFPRPMVGGPQLRDWTLKISDFGLAGFRSNRERTGETAHTTAYVPPEWTLPGDGERRSTPSDIWALGCVYLEFVAWYIGGYKLLEDFEESRRNDDKTDAFWHIRAEADETGCSVPEVKPSVTNVRSFFQRELSPGYAFSRTRA